MSNIGPYVYPRRIAPLTFAQPTAPGYKQKDVGLFPKIDIEDQRKFLARIKLVAPDLYEVFSYYQDDLRVLQQMAFYMGRKKMMLRDVNKKVIPGGEIYQTKDKFGSLKAAILYYYRDLRDPKTPESQHLWKDYSLIKSRGLNTKHCIDVLDTVINVPKEYYLQLLWAYYFRYKQINKLGMIRFPGQIEEAADPSHFKRIAHKLSEFGKECLLSNPKAVDGEPQYQARCFDPGEMETGTDGYNTYSANKDNSWQLLKMRDLDKDDKKVFSGVFNKQKKQRKEFNEKILGTGEGKPNFWETNQMLAAEGAREQQAFEQHFR